MTPAIRIDGVGKKYKITHETQGRYRTLRESLMDAAAFPLRWIQGERRTSHEEFWALNDVSFEVQPGEVVGIVGRNGAGKSTLLKILSRITKPTTGRVELNGRVGSLLEVGTGFHPELTGRENVFLNGSILGMTRREIAAKFDEIVAFAEVEKFLDTPVKRYSSGMYVRLAFAVAAHLEPEILIVDEVLAVGDASFQEKCLEKMKTCATCGSTVLLVSHQLNNVAALSSRAVWLNAGSVAMSGPTNEVLAGYIKSGRGRTQSGEWIDLADRPRRGDGLATLDAVRYYGAAENAEPCSDGPLSIALRVTVHCSRSDARVGVRIRDLLGAVLVDLNTEHSHGPMGWSPGGYEFVFAVERLHLSPGEYRVDMDASYADDHFDDISDAFRLKVVDPQDRLGSRGFGKGIVTRIFTVDGGKVD